MLENGKIVSRIFFLDAVGPQGRPWMWTSGHNGEIRRAAHGYEATREVAMAAFARVGEGSEAIGCPPQMGLGRPPGSDIGSEPSRLDFFLLMVP